MLRLSRVSFPLRPRPAPPLGAAVADLLDRRLGQAPRTIPGAVFLIRLAGGHQVLRRVAAPGAAPVNEHTIFQVMSISKPVVTFAALRLGHLGVLDLDAPVESLLRSWSLPAERTRGLDFGAVTIRRILCHAAGLSVHGYGWVEAGAPRPTPAQLLDGIDGPEYQVRLIHPPGTRAQYSGGGYTLLQQAIEDVTGRPFAAVIQDTVLGPLGMARSTFDDGSPLLASLATRHDAQGLPLPPARIASPAATGLYSCAADLSRFLAALLPGPRGEPPGRGLIHHADALAMTSTQAADAVGRRWALGFYLLRHPGETIFHHGGLKTGWWSQIDGFAQAGHTMVTLTNGDAADEHVKPILADIRELLLSGRAGQTPER